jgi:hypothetical protein
MGLNLDLCRSFGAPKRANCPKCGKTTKTRFDDYDIECGEPFPKPGLIHLTLYCEHCEHEQVFKATVEWYT